MDITERLRHPDLHDRPYPLCAEAAGEIHRLRAELAAMTKRAETAEDTVGCQTDLEKDFAAARAELAEAKTRIAELEKAKADSDYVWGQPTADLMDWQDKAKRTERAEARIAELEEKLEWTEKTNSELATHALNDHRELRARAEQAEKRVGELEEIHRKSGMYGNAGRYWEGRYRDEAVRAERAEAQLAEAKADISNVNRRFDELHDELMARGARAERAEAERDAMRGASWFAALNPSPAGRVVNHEEGARMIQQPEPDDGVIVHEDGSVSSPAGREG